MTIRARMKNVEATRRKVSTRQFSHSVVKCAKNVVLLETFIIGDRQSSLKWFQVCDNSRLAQLKQGWLVLAVLLFTQLRLIETTARLAMRHPEGSTFKA